MFHVPNKYRVRNGPMGSSDDFGNAGAFRIPAIQGEFIVIASDGEGWEHVSARYMSISGQGRTPTWEQMCTIKRIFWDDEDVVMQLHPAKSDYINNHPHVLHLWRPIGQEIPKPPKALVGI